jgi:hypothetical protein
MTLLELDKLLRQLRNAKFACSQTQVQILGESDQRRVPSCSNQKVSKLFFVGGSD